MRLWLEIPLGLLLLIIVLILLILSSYIHFHFRLCRLGKDDRVELDIKAVFGLVKFHYELPAVVYKGFEDGVRVKLEESGIAPVQKDTDTVGDIDKGMISDWLANIKKALRATRGLKEWIKNTMSHVQITKLDWSTDFSMGDAAYTATAAGALWGMKWSMIGWVSQYVRLNKSPRLFVAPVFRDDLCFSTEMVCVGKLSAGYGCYAGLLLLRRISKVEGGLGRWKELLSRKPHEEAEEDPE